MAAAREHLLDLRGAVVDHLHSSLRGGEADYAPGMAHENRCPWPLIVRVKLLQRHDGRPQRADYLAQAGVDFDQTRCERIACAATDHPGFAQLGAAYCDFQYAIAGGVQAWVNAEDARWRVHPCALSSTVFAPSGRGPARA
jgi:hypothetical protein